ncbi:unnamed protein product [Haemonchus placei]|uniref:Small ribosomal subunit protein uS5m n=1 Tax=Haemonchus placei TaxID=6290 RepID=A0A0N4X3N7_HAEPC|nr:unnamed protein product [Haemonchus placei]
MASLLPFTQIRSNTVNFFMRRTSGELWKTITSVSKAGQKKGRMTTRQPIRNLNRFYRIGSSPMKVQFPGLNAPINTVDPDVKITEQSEEEIKEGQLSVRKALEEQKMGGRRRFREKLHPLERGFSGTQLVGQKLGPPPPVDGVSFDDFQTYCLEELCLWLPMGVKRTAVMTRVFGRVHTMAALVITGNGNGLAGYAVGKAPLHRTTTAIVNGMNMAARKLFYVELLEGRTIYQDFYAECRNTRVFAQRRPQGFGLTCHPRLIKICEAIGIKDIYVKVEGSTKNYLALTHAFVTGLLNQETHQQLRLNLDDFYGEGRYPLRKPKPLPFYVDTPGHKEAEWRKHPFRNHEEVMIRLLADGVVPRWTRDDRRKWSEERHEKALAGLEQMPRGIGLSDVVSKSE